MNLDATLRSRLGGWVGGTEYREHALQSEVAANGLGARLAFRRPQRETGKIAAFTIPVASDCHAATSTK